MADSFVSPTPRLRVEQDGAVLRVRFNNPDRLNAFSLDMWEAMPELLAAAERDDGVRVIVFSGEGGRAFASGADISQFEALRSGADRVQHYERMAQEALLAIHGAAKPTIAAIQGYCIGGGVNIALACDLRLATEDSVFGIPAIRLGLGYRYSAMKILVDTLGPAHAKELFFTGKRFDAASAQSMGLVNRVAAPGQFDAVVESYATAVAEGAPMTIRAGKQIIEQCLKASPEVDQDLCTRLVAECFASEDYQEGRKAFMEKRRPIFKGR